MKTLQEAQAEVIDKFCQCRYFAGVGAAVQLLVLTPCASYELSHVPEVLLLYGIIHLQRMLLHLSQQQKLVVLV